MHKPRVQFILSQAYRHNRDVFLTKIKIFLLIWENWSSNSVYFKFSLLQNAKTKGIYIASMENKLHCPISLNLAPSEQLPVQTVVCPRRTWHCGDTTDWLLSIQEFLTPLSKIILLLLKNSAAHEKHSTHRSPFLC